MTFELFLFDHDKIVKNNIWNEDNRFSCLSFGIIAGDNNCIFRFLFLSSILYVCESRLFKCMVANAKSITR